MSTIKALYVQHPDSALPGVSTNIDGSVTLAGNVSVSTAGIVTTPAGALGTGSGGGYADVFLMMGA
jgi:hypothetical protein